MMIRMLYWQLDWTISPIQKVMTTVEKVARTDAKEDRASRIKAASNGTMFLDEIGILSYFLQSKLLSVLHCRKVVRLGTVIELSIDVRVICKTNMPMYQMVSK